MKRDLGLAGAFLLLALGTGVGHGGTLPNGRYFGQTPPGFTPVVFAPGLISLPSRFEYCLTFSPNLDECVFGLTNAGWGVFNLLYTKMSSDSTWIDPIAAPFQGSGDATDPFYSPDGNAITFVSSRPSYPPSNLWRSSREGTGWTTPVKLDPPINSSSNQWGGAVTNDGILYFCSTRPGGIGAADVYRAVTSPGGEVTVENLGTAINSSYLEGSVFAARDGSYVIFESQRPGGYGQSDLYISSNENGVWTTPRNLGPAINTSQIEDCPFISPDGKYMFFNRRRASYTTEPSEIWWVDARAVFHPEQSGVNDSDSRMDGTQSLRVAPNPFVASTTLVYSTPVPGFVSIQVYDVQGRRIANLVNAPRNAGCYSEELSVSPSISGGGVYFCRLQVDDRRLATARALSLK
jgi:hypothetical protein